MKNRLLPVGVALLLVTWGCDDSVATPVAASCSYFVTPTAFNASGVGETTTVNVNTGSSCAWMTMSNSAFLVVVGSGTGSGTATVTAEPNTVLPFRMGTVTIAGQTVTVRQADH